MRHRHPGKYESRTPRGFIVYKRRPLHKLSKSHRDIFQRLDRKPYEVGGHMDFNRRGLERADIYMGRKAYVDIDLSPDKEIEYHTHIKDKDKKISRLNMFPSKLDIKSFSKSPSQSMLIFHNNKAMITTKMRDFRLHKQMLDKIEKGLRKDVNKFNIDRLYRKYKPKYSELGLDLKYIKHNKAMRIPIDIVEPYDKKLITTRRMWPFESRDHVGEIIDREPREVWHEPVLPKESDPFEGYITPEGRYEDE